MRAKIAICASGEGTNFEAVVQASQRGDLPADVVGLITNRANAPVIKKAKKLAIPNVILVPKAFASREEWDKAFVRQLEDWCADWVVLAGFLALIGPLALKRFPHRIINSHPSLLPEFGGHGMYGDRVHAAVLEAGRATTGITVHLIDEIYDNGRVLAQQTVPVLEGDTTESLAARVKAAEVLFYPKVLKDLLGPEVVKD